MMIDVKSCPACSSQSFQKIFDVTDYTVSHETFGIIECQSCTLRITSPRPEDQHLGRYYESPEYISHTNASKTLFDKVYQLSRNIMLRRKWKLITATMQQSKLSILDFGCGTGHFLSYVKGKGAQISGYEPSQGARELAQKITKTTINESISQIESKYDVITLWHVLEHIPNLSETLKLLQTHLKPNGVLFIAVPNYTSEDESLYGNKWAAYDTPRHLWHFSPKSMQILTKNHNLKISKIVPMWLDALYVSILSQKHKTGKHSLGGLVIGTINGLKSNLKAKRNKYSSLIYIISKDDV